MARARINDGLTRWQRYYAKHKDCPEYKARKANGQKKLQDSGHKRKYRYDNRFTINSNAARYRAAKLQRTVGWTDDLVIRMIYEDCPEGMEVDHIIPLQGKNVSGLHVAWNLQYLTKEENCRKGNRYEANN